jgi:cyclopropane-fatty-acyl-phospholipid synthase
MKLLSLEHGHIAYWADFVFYGVAALLLAAFTMMLSPPSYWRVALGLAVFGVLVWTLFEYLMHRFVLHGIEPFARWHAEHHQRPTALIATPTWISATLIAAFLFLPLVLLVSPSAALSFTFGFISGYLTYTTAHHATHHWKATSAWTSKRKRFHARHHLLVNRGDFGVTSQFWDRVLGTSNMRRRTGR